MRIPEKVLNKVAAGVTGLGLALTLAASPGYAMGQTSPKSKVSESEKKPAKTLKSPSQNCPPQETQAKKPQEKLTDECRACGMG